MSKSDGILKKLVAHLNFLEADFQTSTTLWRDGWERPLSAGFPDQQIHDGVSLLILSLKGARCIWGRNAVSAFSLKSEMRFRSNWFHQMAFGQGFIVQSVQCHLRNKRDDFGSREFAASIRSGP